MPYVMRKLRGKDLYRVVNTETKEVKSSGSTKKDAKSQLRLLRGLEKKGGALQAEQIKQVIDNSYKDGKDPEGYVLDRDLSDDRVKVYKDLNSNQVIVAHRGSKGWRDWLDNAYYGFTGDIRGSSTYADAKSRQQKAVDKYGANNIIAVGHSRAGKYVEELNKEQPVKEVITYNKAISTQDAFQSNPENQTDIRTSNDVVSSLTPFQSSKNKTVVIPNDSWNLFKAHGTSALSNLGDKLIGKGFKQMRVGDMRRFIKMYKRAKYGEKMTGGAKLGKKELTEMMKPILEDDDLDEMVGGSIWTDFVKEFSMRHNLKYACSLSKYKEPLKKAYKLKKAGEDWFTPLKETREMSTGSGMEGGNKWTDFVKDYAKKYDTTYGCALSDMGTKNAYKLFKDGQPWYFPKTKEMDTQTDFVDPEPVKAPEDIKPVIGRIQEKLVKLEEVGRKKGAVHYDPQGIVGDLTFVNLMKKYGGKCIVSGVVDTTKLSRIGISIDSRPSFSRTMWDMYYPKLGEQLKECVDRGVKLICIPLEINLDKATDAHANMIVYRPFQRLVERFEPHGSAIQMGDSKVNDSINRQLKKLFEKVLLPWIGEVRYKDAEDICPSVKGFQALEGELGELAQEGGGFCMMWSNFLAEMTLLNPTKSTKEIVDEVFQLTKSDPTYIKSVIRGYVVEVESEIDSLLKTMGKSGFSFASGDAPKVKDSRKEFEPWVLSIIFETKQQSEPKEQYDKLPPKKVLEKKEKDYEEKLKSLTKEQLNNLMALYDVGLPPMSKEDMITQIIFLFNTGEMKKYGASGIKDIDKIIKEKLHKQQGAFKVGLAKDGYFTK